MTRFYEEMFDESTRPPEALRRAQLWLRRPDSAEEQNSWTDIPRSWSEFNKRAESDALPGHRAAGRRSSTQPYAHEYYWAGFVAVGA